MNLSMDLAAFRSSLQRFDPQEFQNSRTLAVYAAAIAAADDQAMLLLLSRGRRLQIPRQAFYEVVLQSYLLHGFPRMLSAADLLARDWPDSHNGSRIGPVSADEGRRWFDDGLALCERIYGENFTRLRDRVTEMSPEIFRWMINEGYGKVYSRDGLDAVTRELANVAGLIVDNRPTQLHSHMRGALHVGADLHLLRLVVEDIGESAGDGYRAATDLLGSLGSVA